jgi:hypothetical protein
MFYRVFVAFSKNIVHLYVLLTTNRCVPHLCTNKAVFPRQVFRILFRGVEIVEMDIHAHLHVPLSCHD